MFNTQNRRFLTFIFIGIITILIAPIPNIISPDIEKVLQNNLGENYKIYLILTFISGSFLMVFLSKKINRFHISKKRGKYVSELKVEWNEEHIKLLKNARKSFETGHPGDALKEISLIESTKLKESTSGLSARLEKYYREKMHGVYFSEQEEVFINRINKDILQLISFLEESCSKEQEYIVGIKKYLYTRYNKRLKQKLANNQPINLKKLFLFNNEINKNNADFISYSGEEIRHEITKIYKDAHGRLLILGVPGSGKTTLLLQLALGILNTEQNAIPVILNLSTWEDTNFNSWLNNILPTELGVGKEVSAKIMEEFSLVLMLDGLDEVSKDDRMGCLNEIGRYGGEDNNHRFVITSRKEEYSEITKEAPVNIQIELGMLTIEQITIELKKMGLEQPGAQSLLKTIKENSLIQQIVKTPFYFNTLQLLFANGNRLNDLNLSSQDIQYTKEEIRENFINWVIRPVLEDNYDIKSARKWLAFLAYEMNRHNKVIFELLDLQYTWHDWTKVQITKARIARGIVYCMTYAIIGGMLGSVAAALIVALKFKSLLYSLLVVVVIAPALSFILGLFFGIVVSLFIDKPIISTKENPNWLSKEVRKEFVEGFSFGLAFGLVFGIMMGIYVGWNQNLILYIFAGIIVGLLIGITTGILLGIAKTLLNVLDEKSYAFIQINEPYQRFYASVKSLHFSILQHWLIRSQLSNKNLLPFRLVRFLNNITKNHLLESDGATWRFRHKILQDHFAKIWEEEYGKNK